MCGCVRFGAWALLQGAAARCFWQCVLWSLCARTAARWHNFFRYLGSMLAYLLFLATRRVVVCSTGAEESPAKPVFWDLLPAVISLPQAFHISRSCWESPTQALTRGHRGHSNSVGLGCPAPGFHPPKRPGFPSADAGRPPDAFLSLRRF